MAPVSHICRYAVSDGVQRRSLIFALIVGTVVNVIYQGNALFDGGRVDIVKFLLTFAAPYAIAVCGEISSRDLPAARRQ